MIIGLDINNRYYKIHENKMYIKEPSQCGPPIMVHELKIRKITSQVTSFCISTRKLSFNVTCFFNFLCIFF